MCKIRCPNICLHAGGKAATHVMCFSLMHHTRHEGCQKVALSEAGVLNWCTHELLALKRAGDVCTALSGDRDSEEPLSDTPCPAQCQRASSGP